MIIPPPPRNLRAELLDLDEAPFEEVKESLGDVRRVNRFLSGYRVLLEHAEKFMLRHAGPGPMSILDVATGSADQPIALVRRARQLGIPVSVTALDINRKMLMYARESTSRYPEIRLVQGDIHQMPFRAEGFDLVVNSLSLHHFTWDEAVAILKAMYLTCRRGFIINDLHRSRIAWVSIYLLTRLLTRNRLTRFDAPVSVMNAFIPEEFDRLAREAGIPQYKIHRHFPYRIAMVCEKNSNHADCS